MHSLDKLVIEVSAAITVHEDGKVAPFSASLLRTVRNELMQMKTSAAFDPTYSRFVLDWPDASSELGKALINTAYVRQKALKRHG